MKGSGGACACGGISAAVGWISGVCSDGFRQGPTHFTASRKSQYAEVWNQSVDKEYQKWVQQELSLDRVSLISRGRDVANGFRVERRRVILVRELNQGLDAKGTVK